MLHSGFKSKEKYLIKVKTLVCTLIVVPSLSAISQNKDAESKRRNLMVLHLCWQSAVGVFNRGAHFPLCHTRVESFAEIPDLRARTLLISLFTPFQGLA